MFLKRKNTVEMFEVFRRRPRTDGSGGGAPDSQAPAGETVRPPTTANPAPASPGLIGTLIRPAHDAPPAERAPQAPAAAAVPAPSPFARLRPTDPVDAMGDRSIVLRYNSALLVLILLVGALFVAFALGVEVGRDRAGRDLAYANGGASTAKGGSAAVADVGGAKDSEAAPFAGAANLAAKPAPGGNSDDGLQTPAPAADPNRFYTVRLCHYDVTRQGKESAETMRKWTSTRVGADVFTANMKINGELRLAVCYGRFPDASEKTQQELERLRGLRQAFQYANLVQVERGPR